MFFFFFFFEIDSEKAEGHTALCRCVVQMLRGPTYQIVVAVIDPKSASYPLLWPRNVLSIIAYQMPNPRESHDFAN